MPKKRHLLVLRRSPYGSGLARASVDLALALGAFEQDFDLLFTGDGVLQLLRDQASDRLGAKNVGRALSSLSLVDVEQVYVDASALARYGLAPEDLVLTAIPVSGDTLRTLLAESDHLVGC